MAHSCVGTRQNAKQEGCVEEAPPEAGQRADTLSTLWRHAHIRASAQRLGVLVTPAQRPGMLAAWCAVGACTLTA